jgi:hypothetical protein
MDGQELGWFHLHSRYHKVASSNTSRLEANTCRLFQIAYEGGFGSLRYDNRGCGVFKGGIQN